MHTTCRKWKVFNVQNSGHLLPNENVQNKSAKQFCYLDVDDSFKLLLSVEVYGDRRWTALDLWIALNAVVDGN